MCADRRYRLSPAGVVLRDNEIEASFRFRDGLIAEHDDRFSLWRWSRQALGPIGLMLGWSPLVRSRVRAQAGENLREFMAGDGG